VSEVAKVKNLFYHSNKFVNELILMATKTKSEQSCSN